MKLLLLCSSASAFIAAPAVSRGPLLHAAALAEDLDLKSWCEAAVFREWLVYPRSHELSADQGHKMALQNAAGMFMFVELAGLMLVFDRATKARENIASTAVSGARSRRYTEQQNAGEEDFLRPLAITEHD